jgi:hypothetical protein
LILGSFKLKRSRFTEFYLSPMFTDKPEASSVHTRVVARIFMRVLLWRQMHLRPHKPLPQDIPKPAYLTYLGQQAQYRTPSFFRMLLDVIVSIVFLGIPYMLYTRAVYAQRMDAEYGLGGVGLRAMGMRDAGPLMLIGGCTCLVVCFLVPSSHWFFHVKTDRLPFFFRLQLY